MHVLKTIAVAFSMFSAVPMPQFAWDEDAMRHPLVAFPLVGLLVGALAWGWMLLCAAIPIAASIRALVLTALPLLVTGGVHLDGFCDTWDALASNRGPERMRQILKDPHIGAFGVMHLVLLLLATFVLWLELPGVLPLPLLIGYTLSRGLAGLSVSTFPLASEDGLARSFADGSDRTITRVGCAVIALAASVALIASGGWAMVLAAAVVFACYRVVVTGRFGGLSGDLCGWFVQTSELWMLVALYATHVMEVVL